MPSPLSTAAAARDGGEVAVSRESGGRIATIQFGHPKGNSLPGTLLRGLAEAVDAAGADADVRVVVLRSREPGPFCGGASFDDLREISDAATGKAFFMGFATLILAMRRCPKFIIARVHGKAVGGGVGIAAAADYAIASPVAAVRLSELAIGIGPFVVGPAIERKIGVGAFQALAVDAATWRDAAWGERHGLFAQVTPDGVALDAAVASLADRLAAGSAEAMARMKTMLWEGTEQWQHMLEERARLSGTLVLTDFARSAIAAAAAR